MGWCLRVEGTAYVETFKKPHLIRTMLILIDIDDKLHVL
jgi:hypothetical protein